MAKKVKKRRKNPQLQERYEAGYKKGFEKGMEFAKQAVVLELANRFKGLNEVEGIGDKTMQKIINHFGREYFEKKEKGL